MVIDPLMAFLDVNAYGDQSVRRALTPLKRLAERTDLAILLLRHLTKGNSRNAVYRGSGSIGIMGATRSTLLIGKSPHDHGLWVLSHTKSSLGPRASSLLFQPITADNGAVRIAWHGACDYDANDLLGVTHSRDGKLNDAREFLVDTLAEGPVKQNELAVRAPNCGVSWRTVERAKSQLGIESRRVGFGRGGEVYWNLPKLDDEEVSP
jgi:hypothetical protein